MSTIEAKNVREACAKEGRFLVRPPRGGGGGGAPIRTPRRWSGAKKKKKKKKKKNDLFHMSLGRVASENFNEHFKAIFDVCVHTRSGSRTKKGWPKHCQIRLGCSVLVYQLALLLHRHERGLQEANVGLKAFLRAA
jgi:hypothetical protein